MNQDEHGAACDALYVPVTAECITVQLVSVLWLGSKGEAEGGECRAGQKDKHQGTGQR